MGRSRAGGAGAVNFKGTPEQTGPRGYKAGRNESSDTQPTPLQRGLTAPHGRGMPGGPA